MKEVLNLATFLLGMLCFVAFVTAGVVLKVAQESETIVQPGTPLIDVGDPAISKSSRTS